MRMRNFVIVTKIFEFSAYSAIVSSIEGTLATVVA